MAWFKDFTDRTIGRMIGLETNKAISSYQEHLVDVQRWINIYEGKPYWSSEAVVSREKAAAAISLLTNKVTSEFESEIVPKKKSSKRAKIANKAYGNLVEKTADYLESLMVTGSGVFKVFVSRGKVGVDFYPAHRIIPIRFDEFGDLVEVYLLDRARVDNKIYTKIEHHKFDDVLYTIKTSVHKGEGVSASGKLTDKVDFSTVSQWSKVTPVVNLENALMPAFLYVKTPYVNNNSISSEYGVSVMSKAEQYLRDYDVRYAEYNTEFEHAESIVFVPKKYMEPNPDPNATDPSFKSKLFTKLHGDNMDNSANRIDEWAPAIRNVNYEQSLEVILRNIEFNFGLAYGEMSQSSEVAKTATEVRASKERSYATVRSYHKLIKTTYETLADMIVYRIGVFSPFLGVEEDDLTSYEVTFYFDDSVAMDVGGYAEKKMAEFSAGIITKEFYLKEVYGMTEEEIKEATGAVDEVDQPTESPLVDKPVQDSPPEDVADVLTDDKKETEQP